MSRPCTARWLASAAILIATACGATPETSEHAEHAATARTQREARSVPLPSPIAKQRLSVASRSFEWQSVGESAGRAPLTKTWVMTGPSASADAQAVWRTTRPDGGNSLRITGPHGVAVHPEVHHAIALRFSAGGAGSLSVAWRDEEPDFAEARRVHGLKLPASSKSRSVLVTLSDLWGMRDAPNVEDGVSLFEIVLSPGAGVSLVTIGLMSELDAPEGLSFLEARVRSHGVWRDGIAVRVPERMAIDVDAGSGDRLAFGLAVIGSDSAFQVSVSGSAVAGRVGPFRCDPEAGWLEVSIPLTPGKGRVFFEVGPLSDSSSDPSALLLVGSVLHLAPDPTDSPDLLLYLEDTLRADRLGTYGYGRGTDPYLQKIAKEGAVFERAFAPSNWTRASVASLMTSLWPPAHGAHSYRRRIPQGLPTLAESLRDAGYLTVALVTNYHAGVWAGLDQGYDIHAEPGAFGLPVDPTTLTSRCLHPVLSDTLDAHAGVRIALFAHSIDPHAPYEPPQDVVRELDRDPMAEAGVRSPEDRDRYRRLSRMYDGEILHNDRWLEALDRALAKSGRLSDTLLLFTSDHGEGFGEHGEWEHQNTLYQEELAVPLVVRWPGHVLAGQRLDEAVSLIDVAPTVLGLLGIEAPDAWQGRDHSARLLDASAAPLPPEPILVDAVAQLL